MMAMQKRTLLVIALMSITLMQAFDMSVASGSSVSTGSSSGGWSMFRQDPSHSGYKPDTPSANSAQLLWNYSTGRMVQSSPSFA